MRVFPKVSPARRAGRPWAAWWLAVAVMATAVALSGPATAGALTRHPYNIGCSLLAKNNLDAAERYFRKALKMNSRDTDALNNLAVVFIRQGRYPQALSTLSRVIRINRRYAGARVNTGVIHVLQDELEEAKPPIRLATHARGGRAAGMAKALAYYNLGLVYAMEGKLDSAKAALRTSMSVRSTPHAKFCLAAVVAAEGDQDTAITLLRQLMADTTLDYGDSVRHNLALAYYERGIAHLGEKKLDEATADFAASKDIEATDYARLGAALLMAQKGQTQEAMGELEQIAATSNTEPVKSAASENLRRLRAKAGSGLGEAIPCILGAIACLALTAAVVLAVVVVIMRRRRA